MKRAASASFKLVLCVVVAFGLFKEIFVQGAIRVDAFGYFTIQSNFLVLFYLLLSQLPSKTVKARCLFRGASLLAITFTCIVYNFVLYRIYQDWNTVGYTLPRTILHVISPIGFIVDWLLFDRHKQMRWKQVWAWLCYPLIYASLSIYVNMRHGVALYFFFDAQNGVPALLKWMAFLFAAFLAVGYAFVGLDRYLGRKKIRIEPLY